MSIETIAEERPSQRSLKLVLFPVVACLAVMVVGAFGYLGINAWNSYSSAKALEVADAAGNRLISAIYDILLERLTTNNALQASDPVTAEVRKEIDARRAAIDAGLAAGAPVILKQDFPNRSAVAKAFRSATDRVHDYRQRADKALALAKPQRDEDVLKSYVPAMTELVNTGLMVWTGALDTLSDGDPLIARLNRIKQLGWTLREISGLERAAIATAISSGKPIPPEGVQKILGYRAQVALAWRLLQALTASDDVDPAIKKALTAATERYFNGFEPLADKIKQLSSAGSAYPIAAKEWVATTNPQIDSLLEIMYAAGRSSEQVAGERKTKAMHNAALDAAGGVFGLLVTVFSVIVVNRRVTAPLGRIARIVERLAAGDLEVAVDDASRRDEIGAVARALNVFRENALTARRLAAEKAEEQAARERRQQTIETSIGEFDRSVREALSGLALAADDMHGTAENVSNTAKDASQQAGDIASAYEQASANVQTVAAATEELAVSIAEINKQVGQSSRITGRAVEQAARTNRTVAGLAEAAQKIGEVVGLISDVASQTNLLALNATIEAARAGEAGKGFAVVASEVKNLASQTGKATDEIAAQINAIQTATKEAVEAIEAIAQTINQVNEISTAIAAAIEEQGATTEEITRNTQQAAKGTANVSSNIVRLSEGATSTGGAASQVLAVANSLREQSTRLGRQVEEFLGHMRTA